MFRTKQWPYYVGAAGAVGLVAWLMARGDRVGSGLPVVPSGPTPPEQVPPSMPGARGQLTGSAPVVVVSGRTYFVAAETNGDVAIAANPARIKAFAEAKGFRDVVVFEEDPPPPWPVSRVKADYYVRATYLGTAPQSFPRLVDRTFGSAKLLDVWEV